MRACHPGRANVLGVEDTSNTDTIGSSSGSAEDDIAQLDNRQGARVSCALLLAEACTVCVCACVCVCLCACVCVCFSVCLCVCLLVWMFVASVCLFVYAWVQCVLVLLHIFAQVGVSMQCAFHNACTVIELVCETSNHLANYMCGRQQLYVWPATIICVACNNYMCGLQHVRYLCPVGRVGQNRIYTPYMIVYLVISLPKKPCICIRYIVNHIYIYRYTHAHARTREHTHIHTHTYTQNSIRLRAQKVGASAKAHKHTSIIHYQSQLIITHSHTSITHTSINHTHTQSHTHNKQSHTHQSITQTHTLTHTHTTHRPTSLDELQQRARQSIYSHQSHTQANKSG